MIASSHIAVASLVLNNIQESLDWTINKKAYLIGSVIPDLNCIFPSHTIKTTLKTFKKHILRVEKSQPGFIKSFTLGMVIHYICDYFCYVHNINSHGPLHTVYEVHLHKHIKTSIENIELNKNNHIIDEIEHQWKDIETHLRDGSTDAVNAISEFTFNGADHIETLTMLITSMNEKYLNSIELKPTKGWTHAEDRNNLDFAYAISICTKVALEITT